MNRREFVKRFLVSSFLVMTSVSAVYEMTVRMETNIPQAQTIASQQASQTSIGGSGSANQAQAPAGYVFVTALSGLTGKTSAYFQHPSYGASLLINTSGQWKAFSATCTHQPCTVQYGGGSSIRCPCHGASFSLSNGSVLGGPAPRPLPEFGVVVQNGDLFVTTSAIN
jgi:Rieske Fe-S protein